jgi:hypothetical protein
MTKVKAQDAIIQIGTKISEINDQKKELSPDNGFDQIRIAALKREQNKLRGAAVRVAKLLTPEGEMANLQRRAENLTKGARHLDGLGAFDTAKGLREDAKLMMRQANDIRTALTAGIKAKTKGSAAKGEFTEKDMFNHIKKRYGSENEIGKIIVGDLLKPKVATIEGYALRLYNLSDKSSQARVDAANTADEVIRKSEEKYWDVLNKITGQDRNNMYSEEQLVDFINEAFPNYKGKHTGGAIRRHLINNRKVWYRKQLMSLPGADDLMPMYLPNKKATELGIG